MKTAGIVAEFNPFHNGHLSLFRRLKENGATHLAVAMSGNFVQRGEPAILSKWARARQALLCGADLVVEIPLPWAVAGAEKFAFGGVSLLAALGADVLGFGSECGSAGQLRKASAALASPLLRQVLQKELKSGATFAAARQKAVRGLFGEETADLLRGPNNILGIEYLKAMKRLGSSMAPFTVRRAGAGHDASRGEGTSVSSARLRTLIRSGRDCGAFLPPPAAGVLREELKADRAPAGLSYVERGVLAKLRTMSREDFSRLPDLSEGLENRIYAASRRAGALSELYGLAKTKRYTLARIRRIVLSAFLGIRASDSAGPVPYLRVLGIGRGGAAILRNASKTGLLPVISRHSELPALNPPAQRILRLEERAADLYALCTPAVQPCGLDDTAGVVTLPDSMGEGASVENSGNRI